MDANESQTLSRLAITLEKKSRRKGGPLVMLAVVVVAVLAAVAVFLKVRAGDGKLFSATTSAPALTPPTTGAATAPVPPKPGDVVLAVSGYIIPRERIEISPKFMGTVKWIGVKKSDPVKKGDVMVTLDDEEYRARLLEAEGHVALAEANLTNAVINLQRQAELLKSKVDSERSHDDAKRARDAAEAELTSARGQRDLARTYLDWCTIRAPIDGTILEKLAQAHELVVPQSFGGTRGPSTALVSLADLNDLQVEIDLNEADTPRVRLNQHCRISPEAYPDKKYGGHVAEIAPEANRAKGTLQVKVQIEKPDRFLTPELTAKVEFLAD